MSLFQETIEPFHRLLIDDDGLSSESITITEATAESGAGLGGSFRGTAAPTAKAKRNNALIQKVLRQVDC